MRRPWLLAVVLGGLALAGRAEAEGLAPVPANNPWCPSACCSWKSRRSWCPDDYCPKTLPVPPPRPPCNLPDNYCIKILPAPPPRPPCCLPDDYCRKPCAIHLGPCVEPWYTCGPLHCK
jgi:hypothetical protein